MNKVNNVNLNYLKIPKKLRGPRVENPGLIRGSCTKSDAVVLVVFSVHTTKSDVQVLSNPFFTA